MYGDALGPFALQYAALRCAVKCKLNRLSGARSKKVEFQTAMGFFSLLRWCVIVEIAFCALNTCCHRRRCLVAAAAAARRRRSEAEEENYVSLSVYFCCCCFFSSRFGS